MKTAEQQQSVRVTAELTDEQAWHIALFLKRVGFREFRDQAENDDQAYMMRDAADRIASALAAVGYAPR